MFQGKKMKSGVKIYLLRGNKNPRGKGRFSAGHKEAKKNLTCPRNLFSFKYKYWFCCNAFIREGQYHNQLKRSRNAILLKTPHTYRIQLVTAHGLEDGLVKTQFHAGPVEHLTFVRVTCDQPVHLHHLALTNTVTSGLSLGKGFIFSYM